MMKRAFVSGRTSAALVAVLVLAGCIATTRPPVSSTVPAMPSAGLQVYAVGDIADCNHRAPADSMAERTSRLVPDGALVLGLGDMAALRALDALVDRGVLSESTGKARSRIWQHRGIFEVLDAYAESIRRMSTR